jgi:hypothetical protein
MRPGRDFFADFSARKEFNREGRQGIAKFAKHILRATAQTAATKVSGG